MAESPKLSRYKENWGRETGWGGAVRFAIGSGNMAILCMRNASGHNYRNSSFIMDVAMGQMARSTERISSYVLKFKQCVQLF